MDYTEDTHCKKTVGKFIQPVFNMIIELCYVSCHTLWLKVFLKKCMIILYEYKSQSVLKINY